MGLNFPRWLVILITASTILGSLDSFAFDKSKVIAFIPESGEYQELGKRFRAAYIAAMGLDEHNPSFELCFVDCSNHNKFIFELTQYERDSTVIAFIGGLPSSVTSLIACSAERAEIPYVIDCDETDSLTWSNREYVFRLVPPLSTFNDGLISWAASVAGRGRTAAILVDTSSQFSAFAIDIEGDLANHWEGGKIWLPFHHDVQNFEFQIGVLKDATPALVFMLGKTLDVSRFLRQCRQADYLPYAFGVVNGDIINNKLISASDRAAEYIVGPLVWMPDNSSPTIRKFFKAIHDDEMPSPDYQMAACASSIQILSSILDDPSINEREELKRKLSTEKFSTLFGEVQFASFGKFHNQNRTNTLTVQFDGEAWGIIWPIESAVIDDYYPIPEWRERDRPQSNRVFRWETITIFSATLLMILIYISYKLSLRNPNIE